MRIGGVVLALIFAGTWLACGGEGDGGASRTAPSRAEPAPPTAPAQTKEKAPVQTGGRDVTRGRALYGQYCASCHGPEGEGDGPVAAGLNPKPAKHSDGRYMNALSDEHLFRVIKEGGAAVGKSPLMAPWGGTLRDEQIWDVVAFVRSLANPPDDL
jgi:mono/diheme cytochrome c family protein